MIQWRAFFYDFVDNLSYRAHFDGNLNFEFVAAKSIKQSCEKKKPKSIRQRRSKEYYGNSVKFKWQVAVHFGGQMPKAVYDTNATKANKKWASGTQKSPPAMATGNWPLSNGTGTKTVVSR